MKRDFPNSTSDARRSILIADNDLDMNAHISKMLSPYYDVINAYNGREAYESVVNEHPDIVISATVMPIMNGYDLLDLIRENKELAGIPVILLSTQVDPESVKRGLHQEADDYLVKPFSRFELFARVKTQLELVRNRHIIKDQQDQLLKSEIEKKDLFISIASHELKTPLTSLKAYTELLAEKAVDLDKVTLQSYLDKSRTFVERLNGLVAELLDVSRIKKGILEYKFEDFNFREMVEESVEYTRCFSSEHTFLINDDIPESFHGDRDRLYQVLQNLLINAVKYSPNGGAITLNCMRTKKELIVSVKDEGLGIPEEARDRIFESYGRARTGHQISGLGLGLYISATIIKRHQGRIWVESEVDKGSVFYFSLPIKISN